MKVFELLKNPENWCKRSYGKTIKGESVDWSNYEAVSWCVQGAICKCYSEPETQNSKRKDLENVIGEIGISVWNDNLDRTHKEVLEALKKADI